MIDTRYFTFSDYLQNELQPGQHGKSATQYMKLYRRALCFNAPTILELGVNKGQSTTVFLTACESVGGRLISVDIKDCSDVCHSEYWTFVQSESTDKASVIAAAPTLADGIDILFIDSLHDPHHVRKEVETWMPLVRAGGTIFFDDVDPSPYKFRNRKANFGTYRRIRKIRNYVIGVYNADESNLYLSMDYGSTGLATLHKLSNSDPIC